VAYTDSMVLTVLFEQWLILDTIAHI